jgi:hypothetical protein
MSNSFRSLVFTRRCDSRLLPGPFYNNNTSLTRIEPSGRRLYANPIFPFQQKMLCSAIVTVKYTKENALKRNAARIMTSSFPSPSSPADTAKRGMDLQTKHPLHFARSRASRQSG